LKPSPTNTSSLLVVIARKASSRMSTNSVSSRPKKSSKGAESKKPRKGSLRFTCAGGPTRTVFPGEDTCRPFTVMVKGGMVYWPCPDGSYVIVTLCDNEIWPLMMLVDDWLDVPRFREPSISGNSP